VRIVIFILACTLSATAFAQRIPEARDLAREARDAHRAGGPLVVLYTQPDCVYCERAKRDYLEPLLADRAAAPRIVEVDVTSHARLTATTRHLDLLREQVESLAAQLDAAPSGFLDDYPEEAYPTDVLWAVATIRAADGVLGTDHEAIAARFIEKCQRPAALGHLGLPPNAEVAELEIGYRVPGPILEMANRLLPIAAPQVRPSRSVRAHGAPPALVQVAAEALVDAVSAEVTALAGDWVSVAVIGPEALLPALAEVLPSTEGVSLLDPLGAKGLEFDAVIVVEPAAIYREVNGPRLLYVAMTRAVQELSLVHSEPLPAVLVA